MRRAWGNLHSSFVYALPLGSSSVSSLVQLTNGIQSFPGKSNRPLIMPPKGGNAKKEAGRAKKADNEVRPFAPHQPGLEAELAIDIGEESCDRDESERSEGGRDLERGRWVETLGR